MASTTFVDGQTVIEADWLNDVDAVVYGAGGIAASNVPITTISTIAATDVQAALAEIVAEKQPKDDLLTAIAGQTTAANKLQGYSGPDAALLYNVGSGVGDIPFMTAAGSTASETVAGLCEKATSAEMTAGMADKYPDAALVKAAIDAAGITNKTPVTLTSQTAVDFTAISAGVDRVTVMFDGVSTNGSNNIIVQLGGAGGIETSGYLGGAFNAATSVLSTTGFDCSCQTNSGVVVHGAIVLNRLNGNTWTANGVLCPSIAGGNVAAVGGAKTLSGELTQLRITTVGGTDAFDAGTVNISYDGA